MDVIPQGFYGELSRERGIEGCSESGTGDNTNAGEVLVSEPFQSNEGTRHLLVLLVVSNSITCLRLI